MLPSRLNEYPVGSTKATMRRGTPNASMRCMAIGSAASELAVLKAIRETDASGASVGDPETWTRMVEASIADAEDDRG